MRSFFVFDVESIGLHGEGFAVAGGVYLENGAVQWEFSEACPPEEAKGADSDRAWVKENCPRIEPTCNTPKQVRDAFWREWMKAKAYGAQMAAECQWPVEAGFVRACIADDASRTWDGPYPFHEIASFMAAADMDPMATYERTPSEQPPHSPLADARLSARLLAQAIRTIERWCEE